MLKISKNTGFKEQNFVKESIESFAIFKRTIIGHGIFKIY
jgi:hypothetical protein